MKKGVDLPCVTQHEDKVAIIWRLIPAECMEGFFFKSFHIQKMKKNGKQGLDSHLIKSFGGDSCS